MKKLLLVCVFCLCGCLSSETKILSRKIAISTQRQQIELVAKLQGDESPEAAKLRKRAAKLSEVTSGLADLLGAPKEVE